MISLNVATVRSLGKGNITTMWNEWQGYITFKYKKLEDSITIKNNMRRTFIDKGRVKAKRKRAHVYSYYENHCL